MNKIFNNCRYYDSDDNKLVKKDNWLRNRNNNWEIKIPYPGKQISSSKSTVYQYISIEK